MIPARYRDWVFVFFMTLLMGGVLSALFELLAHGFGYQSIGEFLIAWAGRFARTYVVVVPTVVVVLPIAKRLTLLVVTDESQHR